ncbi:hypothetical protein [Crenalkalicoccus roseus]|uniref:hypothetical protein n=1 Tax=Crenalkalicoccus roseus TaxID=1485588 RepID=UPI0010816905|nr:hypothetical protein [Crenalkalicoccus roseus]
MREKVESLGLAFAVGIAGLVAGLVISRFLLPHASFLQDPPAAAAQINQAVWAYPMDASRRNIIATAGGSVCAEPPPDTASTVAAQLSAQLAARRGSDAEGSGQVAQELRSAVEKLYERSQGIQALRDLMFRLCEAKINNLINEEQYRSMTRHVILTLNFVVPFEQCAGLVRTATSLSQGAGASTSLAPFFTGCFEQVSTYARAMSERLNLENDAVVRVISLENEIGEYQAALHWFIESGLSWHPSVLPGAYHRRLAADEAANRIVGGRYEGLPDPLGWQERFWQRELRQNEALRLRFGVTIVTHQGN